MRRHDRDFRQDDPPSHVVLRPRPVAPVVYDWQELDPELGVGDYPDGLDPT